MKWTFHWTYAEYLRPPFNELGKTNNVYQTFLTPIKHLLNNVQCLNKVAKWIGFSMNFVFWRCSVKYSVNFSRALLVYLKKNTAAENGMVITINSNETISIETRTRLQAMSAKPSRLTSGRFWRPTKSTVLRRRYQKIGLEIYRKITGLLKTEILRKRHYKNEEKKILSGFKLFRQKQGNFRQTN